MKGEAEHIGGSNGNTSDAPEANSSPLDVLVIDDDAAVRSTLVSQVKRLGMSCVGWDPMSDIYAAVDKLAPSLILLDLSLGNTDAVEVLQRLGTSGFPGRVMLVSGRDQAVLEQVRSIGTRYNLQMLPSITKPVRSKELSAALQELIATSSDSAPLLLVDLEEAIEQSWLELWYQPKVQLNNSSLHGAEALIRLRHPELGVVPPMSFIPSSTTDAYEKMTAFVIDAAARDWAELGNFGLNLKLSINASVSMIQRPSFVQMIREAWPDPAKKPGLIIEVTEDEVITDLVVANEIATQLRLYDVEMSIDDFGVGYTSFSRLRDLPFSELKLDRSFVTGCTDSAQQRAVCESVAAMAKQFGVTSVAEGIETKADYKTICEAGFDVGQGFLFARPAPFGQFQAMIENLRQRRSQARAG